MKLPRDISGTQLAKVLERYGYVVARQTGSHLRWNIERDPHGSCRASK